MDSLLNEMLSRLKGFCRKDSWFFCSVYITFSSAKYTGLESLSFQALGPGSWKSFTLWHKARSKALPSGFLWSYAHQQSAFCPTERPVPSHIPPALYYLGQFWRNCLKKKKQPSPRQDVLFSVFHGHTSLDLDKLPVDRFSSRLLRRPPVYSQSVAEMWDNTERTRRILAKIVCCSNTKSSDSDRCLRSEISISVHTMQLLN